MNEIGVILSEVEVADGDCGPPPRSLYALKEGDTFIVADAAGDIVGRGDGLFHNDTRLLSRLVLRIGRAMPSLLSAAVSRDNVFFTAHLTNRPLPVLGGKSTPQGVLHIERARFLWGDKVYERIHCANYSAADAVLPLAIHFASDFADMFEVRGTVRAARGHSFPAEIEEKQVCFRYQGLDGVMRTTVINFSQPPRKLSSGVAEFAIPLAPEAHADLYLEVGCHPGEPGEVSFRRAAAVARTSMRSRIRSGARVTSSGRLFNEWLEKSRADLALLTTNLETGPYPYAGVPWFSTPFGRDAIITALQMLWLDESLARGVLTFLARNQARETSPFFDSEPGKIMHETRKGEMTKLGEVPFAQYYGGVDTTPLFVMLAGAYAERTGDLAFIDELWPALERAMEWIEGVADSTPHGFLVYARGAKSGLVNQGWKDSDDSVFHKDGRIPRGPIAVIEVQGYFFAALLAMADLAARRGDAAAGAKWHARAQRLREAVERQFWMNDVGMYGIAIDGEGALCRVRSSNPGHLLYVGLPAAERAARLSAHLMSIAFDNGWGIRTLSPSQVHYNPMSYHNGSVWPHDTALCVAGIARYGERTGVIRFLNEMFEAAVNFGMRLPELFCGFPRRPGEPPIAYPVACLPQAWAAGSVFMLLQAGLGLRIDGWRQEIHVVRPALPMGLDRLEVRDIAVGRRRVNLVFQRLDGRIVAFTQGGSRDEVPLVVHH
jgi:glycogen debranching enzyme